MNKQFHVWFRLLLCLPATLPFIGPSLVWPRLIGIGITLTPSFLLLSMSYEAVFYTLLLVTLAVWIKLEQLLDSSPSISPWRQLRRSYFFLFFTLLSFFGLGKLKMVLIFARHFFYSYPFSLKVIWPVSTASTLRVYAPLLLHSLRSQWELFYSGKSPSHSSLSRLLCGPSRSNSSKQP